MKIKLAFLLLLICSSVWAIDPWGEPVILSGSMTLMASVSIDGNPAQNGDVLGAFVTVGGYQYLRGKGNISVISGVAGCLLQIFTETSGEPVFFKVWDESAQTGFVSEQSILTEVNASVGSYPDNLFPIAACDSMLLTDPWLEPAVLSGSMTVMASVSINGIAACDGDILAAFVTVNDDVQLRGKAPIQVLDDIAGCLIQVFTEQSGEDIIFRVWDHSAQGIFTDLNPLSSLVNGTVGSYPTNLYPINALPTLEQLGNPIFSPPAETYTTAQSIHITGANAGASIHYTTDGSLPTETSPVYINPISIPLNSTLTVKAKAFLAGFSPSNVSTATYTITGTVSTPGFSPAGGSYTSSQNVMISCATAGATIRYTTNGSDPTENSLVFSNAISVSTNSTVTIKAKAFVSGWEPSNIASATYTVTGTVNTPMISPPSGTYTTAINVSVFCSSSGATIRYTTNGSEPTETSAQYSAPVNIPLYSTITFKAKAFKNGWNPSQTATTTYIITGTVASPTFEPAAGTYQTAQDVFISCATEGATIRYTTNGLLPTETSELYVTPIPVPLGSTVTVKAKAFRSGWTPSSVVTSIYQITGTVATPVFSPEAGAYEDAIDVSISSATPGAIIRYTLDLAEPDLTSTIYSQPIHLVQDTTIKAKAFLSNWLPSATATANYEVSLSLDDEHLVPEFTGIHSIAPNPFSDHVKIKLGIANEPQDYRLYIYNIKGECVFQTIGRGKGIIECIWNGKSSDDRRLSSGVYLVAFTSGNIRNMRRVVLQ